MTSGFRIFLLAGVAASALTTGALAAQENEAAASGSALTVLAQNATAGEKPIVLAQATAQVIQVEEVQVTSRRVAEDVQRVPIAVSVTSAETVANTGAFNIGRLQQLLPSLTLYTQNPRNTSVNIRGIGSPLGLTNDGIEQGVGIYIDNVYYNRVASSTLDFIDIQQIEVLRGPQGTLYGKNTTAGAINITTRAPNFDAFEARGEFSVGNYEFKQAKASFSGPITDDLAFRISLSNSTRRGTVWNTKTSQWINAQDNLGLRGTLQWLPTESLKLTFSADYNLQDPLCCAAYYARVGTTQRALNRQYPSLAAAFGYAPPSTNPFDRITDIDAPLRARNEHGGASLVAEWGLGGGTLTSVTAWRYWDWGPRNDRDYTGLPITPNSNNPTHQDQYQQEIRYAYAGEGYDFVTGLFLFNQQIHTTGTESQGTAASRWTLNPGNVAPGAPGCGPTAANQRACNPAVLNNLTAANDIVLKNSSAAVFGKLNWKLTDALTVSPGIRFNYDQKSGHYSSVVTGTASDGTRQLVLYTGPYSNDPWIVDQRSVRAPIFYAPNLAKSNISYDINLSYQVDDDILAYATYAKGYKSGGINLNGVPVDAANQPIAAAYTIKPEDVNAYEIGLKTQFLDKRATLNVTGFWTTIDDYQANVNNGALGLVRGYLANAGGARVRGFEVDFNIAATEWLTAYANGTYNDHAYTDFIDAPCPIELSGGTTVTGNQVPGPAATPGALSAANCNITGQWLPGISNWALSWGGETQWPANFWNRQGEVYFGYDASFRSKFSSSASRSIYMDVAGYALHNFRIGWRSHDGLNLSLWVRNAFDQDYFDQLLAAPSNTGLVAGIPADPRTFGATARFQF